MAKLRRYHPFRLASLLLLWFLAILCLITFCLAASYKGYWFEYINQRQIPLFGGMGSDPRRILLLAFLIVSSILASSQSYLVWRYRERRMGRGKRPGVRYGLYLVSLFVMFGTALGAAVISTNKNEIDNMKLSQGSYGKDFYVIFFTMLVFCYLLAVLCLGAAGLLLWKFERIWEANTDGGRERRHSADPLAAAVAHEERHHSSHSLKSEGQNGDRSSRPPSRQTSRQPSIDRQNSQGRGTASIDSRQTPSRRGPSSVTSHQSSAQGGYPQRGTPGYPQRGPSSTSGSYSQGSGGYPQRQAAEMYPTRASTIDANHPVNESLGGSFREARGAGRPYDQGTTPDNASVTTSIRSGNEALERAAARHNAVSRHSSNYQQTSV